MKRQQINEDSSRPQKRQKSEGKLGIIESITLQNFMCHENLHLKLGAHVNFIIGQNGSGKSAILTAIILALGGNSRSTDRYSSIKGFVKNGKNKGKIELVLRNSGPSAYKPKVYGEKIIIIREFNKEGVTTYKIKSESGTICSNQKSELMNIKDALDIMIESPVCVLTQANSKKFLISKDAKEDRLFEFFCKGSGIERLEIAYKYLERLNSESKEEIEKKKQNIPELKKEIKKLKKIIDNSDKISDYQNELTWAAVIQMEKYVEGKKAEYKQLENERENNIEQLKKCEDHYEVNSVKLEEYGKKKEESEISMNQCREDLEKLKFTNETCSSSVRNCRGKLEQLLRDKKQLKEDMLGLKTSIQEQNAKNDKNIEEENKQRMEAMERLKENNSELAKDVENCEKIRSEKMEIQAKIEKNIRELNVEVKNNYRLKELEDSLLASKKALINKLNAFGEHTEKVLGDLNNESVFKKQPVGPIGLFLELKEPKWADAVDLAIGGRNLLNSFCVDNHSDSKILRNILMKYYSNIPSIIVSPFESQVFDVRGHEAHSLFPTVLDMLTIKNPVVANCLIDQAAIEKKILVGDRNEMRNLLQVCPQNCRSAYFLNCDQICYEPTRLYSAGNFRPRSNLTAIRLEDIKILEEAFQKEREAVETKKVTLQKLPLELNELSTEIKDLNNKIGRLSTRLKLNYSEIKELQYTEKLKDVNCLMEDLQLMQSQYETKQAEIDKYTEKVSELEKKKKENEHELNTKKILLQSCCNSYKKYCSEVKTLQKNQDTINIAKERLKTELKTHEKKCVTCLNKLNELIEKTDNSRSNAEQFSERINTVRSVEEIKHLIKETKKVIELQSDCDREDIKNKYNQKLEALQIAEHELERIEEDLKLINEMLQKRKSKISQIITESERYIQYIFTSILNVNGYTGSLEFDDTNKKLKMVVAPTKSCRGRNNHNSLSGGERSFVTIAFLIALWENSRMPFKILDEYDVFMDSSNRQLSFKLLSKKAKTMKKNQFIFLSPLDLPQIDDSSLVEIIRMAPPKRKHNETAVDTE